MVLVSFALVVAATITLVVGLLQSGLTLIYVSIACSVLAGLVLAVAVLRGRPEEAPAAPARATPTPTPTPTPSPAPAATGARSWETSSTATAPATPPPSPEPAPAASWRPPSAEEEPEAEREPQYAGALAGRLFGRRDDATAQMSVTEVEEEEEEEEAEDVEPDGFPIPDYDRLRASEILRQLGDLTPGQLEAVRAREVAGMNRFTVLSRIDAQLEASAASSDWDLDEEEWRAPEDDAVPLTDVGEEEEPEPVVAPAPTRGRITRRTPPTAPPLGPKKAARKVGAAKKADAPTVKRAPTRKAPVRAVVPPPPEPAPAPAAPTKRVRATAKAAAPAPTPTPTKKAAAKKIGGAVKLPPAPAKAAPVAKKASKKAAAAKAPLTAKEAVAKARASLAEKAAAKKTTRGRKAPPS